MQLPLLTSGGGSPRTTAFVKYLQAPNNLYLELQSYAFESSMPLHIDRKPACMAAWTCILRCLDKGDCIMVPRLCRVPTPASPVAAMNCQVPMNTKLDQSLQLAGSSLPWRQSIFPPNVRGCMAVFLLQLQSVAPCRLSTTCRMSDATISAQLLACRRGVSAFQPRREGSGERRACSQVCTLFVSAQPVIHHLSHSI